MSNTKHFSEGAKKLADWIDYFFPSHTSSDGENNKQSSSKESYIPETNALPAADPVPTIEEGNKDTREFLDSLKEASIEHSSKTQSAESPLIIAEEKKKEKEIDPPSSVEILPRITSSVIVARSSLLASLPQENDDFEFEFSFHEDAKKIEKKVHRYQIRSGKYIEVFVRIRAKKEWTNSTKIQYHFDLDEEFCKLNRMRSFCLLIDDDIKRWYGKLYSKYPQMPEFNIFEGEKQVEKFPVTLKFRVCFYPSDERIKGVNRQQHIEMWNLIITIEGKQYILARVQILSGNAKAPASGASSSRSATKRTRSEGGQSEDQRPCKTPRKE